MHEPLRILISRPGDRALPLRRAIEALGAEVVELAAMRLEVLPETTEMRQAWLDFDQYHRVVAVSPFAARCVADELDRYWPQLPIGPHFYAVGTGTARVLHDRLGVRVHVPPVGEENTSEALLTLPSLQDLAHQRVLMAAGEGGRALLGEEFARRGARVTRLALYRRVLAAPCVRASEYLAGGNFTALVVSSGELLEHLAGWCSSVALNQPLIVSSRRLATLAQTLGYSYPIVAQGATPVALADAVANVLGKVDSVDHDDLEKG
jgi:uroporphyrinogen-III synthase